jgi:hypothetical protein
VNEQYTYVIEVHSDAEANALSNVMLDFDSTVVKIVKYDDDGKVVEEQGPFWLSWTSRKDQS